MEKNYYIIRPAVATFLPSAAQRWCRLSTYRPPFAPSAAPLPSPIS